MNEDPQKQVALNMFGDSMRWRHGAQYGFPSKGPQSMEYGIPSAEPVWVAWTHDGKPAFGPTCEQAMDSAMKGAPPAMPMAKMQMPMQPDEPDMGGW